jgi:N6-L-threonylcarbamoyladenine synthase
LLREDTQIISEETRTHICEVLVREPGLEKAFFEFISECETPAIDAVAVTAGPGLEPALWVGINFARALALVWNKPLVAVNHMEGHIFAALARRSSSEGGTKEILIIENIKMPVLALLISGGHTQLVLMQRWLQYELIGETRDDAVGEAFDKVARMLSLPYPGGPEISKLAEQVRASGVLTSKFKLPRPMIHEDSCDFSFAGLKTAVMNLIKKESASAEGFSETKKKYIALEFENAITDVLWHKTSRALDETGAKTLVIGGGVSANIHIQRIFAEKISREHLDVELCIPSSSLSTDNAIMIALAGYFRAQRKEFSEPFDKLTASKLRASGNLPLI